MKKPLTILLAEDDIDDQEFFQEALLHSGIPVELTIVENGLKLMENLKSPTNVDLIFLDINMPYKNGIECLREIRSDESLKDNICIVFTTSTSSYIKEQAFEAGANLFLTKPSTYEEYTKVVNQALAATF